jgi:hypothetical protein
MIRECLGKRETSARAPVVARRVYLAIKRSAVAAFAGAGAACGRSGHPTRT